MLGKNQLLPVTDLNNKRAHTNFNLEETKGESGFLTPNIINIFAISDQKYQYKKNEIPAIYTINHIIMMYLRFFFEC